MRIKTFFLSFLLLITFISSCFIVNSDTGWKTFRYDTLHDSIPEETFSRFNLGIFTAKEWTFGTNNLQPKVIQKTLDYDDTSHYIVIPATSTNVLYVINDNYDIIDSMAQIEVNVEFTIADFHTETPEEFDIVLLTENVDDTQNFTWYQFNGTDIVLEYTENFGNLSDGVTCDDITVPHYCVFVGAGENHTFFKVEMDLSPTIETLKIDTSDNGYNGSLHNCLKVPILRDADYDNNKEAVYCDNIEGSSYNDLVMVDVTNLELKNSFGSNGLKEDVYSQTGSNAPPIYVNVDGGDEPMFEIAYAYGDCATTNTIGLLTVQGNNYNDNYPHALGNFADSCPNSLSRTDLNNDNRYDILIGRGVTDTGLYCIDGVYGLDGTRIFYNCFSAPVYFDNTHFVISDLDNTGSIWGKDGIVTSRHIGKLNITTDDYATYPVSSTITWGNFSDSWDGTNPIVADTDGDNIYEIIYSKNGNTTIYDARYSNQPVVFLAWVTDTGSPICADETVTFYCLGTESEGEMVNCGVDCYNNGTITWGSFTSTVSNFEGLEGLLSPTTSCTYDDNDIGKSYPIMLYMSDEGHVGNTEIYQDTEISMVVSSENATLCYNSGEGTFQFINGTLVSSIQQDALDDLGGLICTALGVCSTKSKAFLFLILLIMLAVMVANTTKNTVVTLIVTFAFCIISSLPTIELIPIWVGLLIVILGVGFSVQFGKGYFGGGDGK